MLFVRSVVVGFVLNVLRSVVGFSGSVFVFSFYLVFVNFLRLFLFMIVFFIIMFGILVGICGRLFVFGLVFIKFLFDDVFVVVVMLGMGYCWFRGIVDMRGDGGGEGIGEDNMLFLGKYEGVFVCDDKIFWDRKFDVFVEEIGDEFLIIRLFFGEFDVRFDVREDRVVLFGLIFLEDEWIMLLELNGDGV